jgi:hypothetical protein
VSDLLALLWAPFLMCLVLTGIHAYLGIHVIAREVVFVGRPVRIDDVTGFEASSTDGRVTCLRSGWR